MACKKDNQSNKQAVKGTTAFPSQAGGSITLPSSDFKMINVYIPGILNGANQDPLSDFINLPRAKDFINQNTLALGKRLYVIDNEVVGPTLNQRAEGVEVDASGQELKDRIRLYLGNYWTINETANSLMYLNGSTTSPFKIKRYNVDKATTINISDIKIDVNLNDIASLPSMAVRNNDIDVFLSSVSQKDTISAEESVKILFGTQQWILLQADPRYFTANKGDANTTPTQKLTINDIQTSVFSNLYSPLSFDRDNLFNEDLFSNFAKGGQSKDGFEFSPLIEQGVTYFDHCFELLLPFSDKELEKISITNNPLVASVNAKYNFFIETYENKIQSIPETLLPNMYIVLNELNNKVDSRQLSDFITIDQRIPIRQIASIASIKRLTTTSARDPSVQKIAGRYLNNFSTELLRNITPQRSLVSTNKESQIRNNLQRRKKKFSNIGIPHDNLELFKEFNDKKSLFPMYVDLRIPTDNTTVIAQTLKDSNLSKSLMSNVIASSESQNFMENRFFEVRELLKQAKNKLGGYKTEKLYQFDRNNRRVWDITKWLVEFEAEGGNLETLDQTRNIVNDIGLFLGKDDTEDKLLKNSPEYKFFRSLMKIIFVGKLRSLIKQKFRTYEEMMAGKLAYSETVMYKVEKYVSDINGIPRGEPIQSFYFPNSNDIEVINFIDTQVKYDKRYSYRVMAYQAVIGTEYEYSNLETKENLAWLLVTQRPSIKLIEVPYFGLSSAVIDNPSVTPDVQVIPYKGVDNKLLFFFNANTGQFEADPILIQEGDQKKYDDYRKKKNLEPSDKIRFRTDDHAGVFQIFRIEKHPSSYRDFSEGLIAGVNTDVDSKSIQKATSASFVDRVQPNVKYYYTFRVVDNHGHVGYPSPIYRVQLINDSGAIYPIIEVVELKKKKKEFNTKPMRKWIQIKPAFSQAVVNEEKTGIPENAQTVKDVRDVSLGTKEDTVWGKKYKIRLKSKNSGKVIDFNVNFTNKFVRVKDEDEID